MALITHTSFTVRKNRKGDTGSAYSIQFKLNNVTITSLNYDNVKDASSDVTFEANFFNNGASFIATKAVISCWDSEGNQLGSSIEVSDSSNAIADGGNLYLSKDCKTIQCQMYSGNKCVCTSSIPVVKNAVSVKSVQYKFKNNQDANASINWDKQTAVTTYPTQKPDKGKYCYVMTIVTYTDGTMTNSVSTSYTPTDGIGVTTTTTVTYARTSNNVQPSSFPLTSVPTDLQLGEYLWSKTVVTYKGVNTETTTSIAVSRVGKDGAVGYSLHMLYSNVENPNDKSQISTSMQAGYDYIYVYSDQSTTDDPSKGVGQKFKKIKGEPGVDGTQYKTVESYAYGDDNTTVPTTGWSDSISGGAQGKYLWNKETAQHKAASDSNWVTDSVTTHCIGYIAKDGEPGANFTGVLEYYKATDKNEAPAIDSSWQSTPTASGWSAEKPYLWNYEIVTRDKGANITTAVHLDSVWGSKGDTGATPDVWSIIPSVSIVTFDVNNGNTPDVSSITFTFYKNGVAVTSSCQYRPYAILNNQKIYFPAESGKTLSVTNVASMSAFPGIGVEIINGNTILADAYVKFVKSAVNATSYRLQPVTREATVKATAGIGKSKNSSFTLSAKFCYKYCKKVGNNDETTIDVTKIEVSEVFANNTESGITSKGSSSTDSNTKLMTWTMTTDGTNYTASVIPPTSLKVTVISAEGSLVDYVPITMHSGLAIDMDNALGTLNVTAADNKRHIASLSVKGDKISEKVKSMAGGNLLYDAAFKQTYTSSNVTYLSNKADANNTLIRSSKVSTTVNVGGYNGINSISIAGDSIQWQVPIIGVGSFVFSIYALDTEATSFGINVYILDANKKQLDTVGDMFSGNTEFTRQEYAFEVAESYTLSDGVTYYPAWIMVKVTSTNNTTSFAMPQLEYGKEASTWSPSAADAYLATGVDIYNKKIELTSDNVEVKNNSGKTTALLDKNGKLNVNVLDADKVQAGKMSTTQPSTDDKSHTELFGNTTIWYQKNGKKGIEVVYDDAGVPHLYFYNAEEVAIYDMGPNGVQMLLQDFVAAYVTANQYIDVTSMLNSNFSAVLLSETRTYVGQYHAAHSGSTLTGTSSGFDGKYIEGYSSVDTKGNNGTDMTLADGKFAYPPKTSYEESCQSGDMSSDNKGWSYSVYDPYAKAWIQAPSHQQGSVSKTITITMPFLFASKGSVTAKTLKASITYSITYTVIQDSSSSTGYRPTKAVFKITSATVLTSTGATASSSAYVYNSAY